MGERFVKQTAWAVTGVLLCGLALTRPARADNNKSTDDAAANQTALMNLYFGKEPMVEGTTHYPKPISQVAEDVTVITAKQIEAMHANSVGEVLERIPGVFVQFDGDYAPMANPSIEGSDYENVLVLVDGIRWNEVAADFPRTNQIPVSIIDRIEVIKGAASSAWGSALGGVVNIITKKTGATLRPHGSATVGVGEHGTDQEYGQVNGAAGGLGYYLYAGHRESDGIQDNRYFDDTDLFGKFSYRLPHQARLTAELGSSQPAFRYLYAPAYDYTSAKDERVHWYSAALDSPIGQATHLFVQLYDRDNRSADAGSLISTGQIADDSGFRDEQRGVNSRLAWEKGRHTLVLGGEYLYREITNEDLVNNISSATLSEEILAVYLNDTVRLGAFTVTPGLRYDHLTVADDETSPSLGATYRLSNRTLLRASVSRGFRKPPLNLKELPPGEPPYNTPSPELASETEWTYEGGIETTAVPYLWLKATLFRHQSEDVWVQNNAGAWVNDGKEGRTGVDAALKTVPFHGLSLGAGYTFVHLAPDNQDGSDLYKVNLLFAYDNQDLGLEAQLFGNYVWWGDSFSPTDMEGKFDTFVWDLTLHQRLWQGSAEEVSAFFKVHNLFDGSQYAANFYPNAPRWVEGGLQVRF